MNAKNANFREVENRGKKHQKRNLRFLPPPLADTRRLVLTRYIRAPYNWEKTCKKIYPHRCANSHPAPCAQGQVATPLTSKAVIPVFPLTASARASAPSSPTWFPTTQKKSWHMHTDHAHQWRWDVGNKIAGKWVKIILEIRKLRKKWENIPHRVGPMLPMYSSPSAPQRAPVPRSRRLRFLDLPGMGLQTLWGNDCAQQFNLMMEQNGLDLVG